MQINRRGSTRVVFLVGRWAVKIPSWTEWRLFLLGLLANMQETRLSRCCWPELCPVLFALPGGFLIIMRRARELTDGEFLALDHEGFIERGGYVIPVEAKSSSFGWLDGKIVAIDYGN